MRRDQCESHEDVHVQPSFGRARGAVCWRDAKPGKQLFSAAWPSTYRRRRGLLEGLRRWLSSMLRT